MGLVAASCGDEAEASDAWCEAVGELDAAIGQIGQPDPEVVTATFGQLAAAADTIGSDAPDSVADEAASVEAAIDEAAETGQPTLFEPPTSTAMAVVHTMAAAECAYESISVTAVDFAFEGVPDRIPAGRVALAFENHSEDEPHELVLFRKADGVEAPMVDLLALPMEEAMTKASSIAFTMAEPGGENGLILDLEPGSYGIVCFIPVGGGEEGEPHFAHGMVDDFVVG